MPVDPPREEVPPRRSEHPKVKGCRRHRDASPKRLVRDPALAPKSGGRWFELVLAILPRLPAYMMGRPLAADAYTRRCVHLRATHAPPEGGGVEPSRRSPEGLDRGRDRRRTQRCALADSWLRRLQQAGGPARARQSSCSPGRPLRDPEIASPLRSGDRRVGAEAPRVRLVPHNPPVVVIRRAHRNARAEMDRSPSQAVPTGVESASVPSAPKRFRSPDRCEPGGR